MSKTVLFALGYKMYPDITGGMEIFNYRLIEALQDDLEVYYTCGRDLGFKSARYLPLSERRPQKVLLPLQVLRHLLRHREIRSVVFSYSEASWFIWWLYTLMTKWLHLRSTIVIHFGNPSTGSAKHVLQAFFRSATNVIAVSEDIKRNYDSAFGLNCQVIPPAIPFRKALEDRSALREEWGISPDGFLISMVGSLKGMKNPDTAIRALAGFTKEETDQVRPYLLLAGDGPSRTTLEQEVTDLGLQGRVRFLGRIPQEQVCRVLHASDCFLIASDFEGTSLSLLEAMSNGLPILASDVPGLKDMIRDGDNGLLFPCKDAAALKAGILRLHSDPDAARKMGQNAVRSFEVDYSFDRVRQLYLDIL